MSVCLTVIYITIHLTFWQVFFAKNFRKAFSAAKAGLLSKKVLAVLT
jgi:hypothetical protein